jgi:hypothetical protein
VCKQENPRCTTASSTRGLVSAWHWAPALNSSSADHLEQHLRADTFRSSFFRECGCYLVCRCGANKEADAQGQLFAQQTREGALKHMDHSRNAGSTDTVFVQQDELG